MKIVCTTNVLTRQHSLKKDHNQGHERWGYEVINGTRHSNGDGNKGEIVDNPTVVVEAGTGALFKDDSKSDGCRMRKVTMWKNLLKIPTMNSEYLLIILRA